MLSLIRRYEMKNIAAALKIAKRAMPYATDVGVNEEMEFRILQLTPDDNGRQNKRRTLTFLRNIPEPRANSMSPDQNWQAVWPTARTFHPSTVPLPLLQGYKNSKGVHPGKYGNAELMKIPNFLHLPPPAVEKHCEALKKFCTKWPEELETEEMCEKYFPLEIITSDYCYSSPTIREPLARIVSLKVKVSSLHLDAHAKDKLLRLVGDRYNPKTDTVTITVDRCPLRKQNLDYAKYVLTALYHVSWRTEPWEAEKSEADMEYYDWEKNKSKVALISSFSWPNSSTDINYEDIPHATEYKRAVSDLLNNEEEEFLIKDYKQAVKNMLNLQFDEATQ